MKIFVIYLLSGTPNDHNHENRNCSWLGVAPPTAIITTLYITDIIAAVTLGKKLCKTNDERPRNPHFPLGGVTPMTTMPFAYNHRQPLRAKALNAKRQNHPHWSAIVTAELCKKNKPSR